MLHGIYREMPVPSLQGKLSLLCLFVHIMCLNVDLQFCSHPGIIVITVYTMIPGLYMFIDLQFCSHLMHFLF